MVTVLRVVPVAAAAVDILRAPAAVALDRLVRATMAAALCLESLVWAAVVVVVLMLRVVTHQPVKVAMVALV
jgi:hypothetical protein